MKLYAREALNSYGVANYVLSEDRFTEDSDTGEIFVIPEENDSEEQLVERLRTGTFSLSGKSYPRQRPCAPAPSPVPIIINNCPSYQKLPKKTVDELCNRLQKPTFAKQLRSASEPPEPSTKICSSVKWHSDPNNKGKQRPMSYYNYTYNPRSGQSTPRSEKNMTPRLQPRDESQLNDGKQRAGSTTPRSEKPTQRSGIITPRSDNGSRKSGVTTPRSVTNTPQPQRGGASKSGSRSGMTTPRSVTNTPEPRKIQKGGVSGTRSGMTTPRSVSNTPQPQVSIDKKNSRSGMNTPRSAKSVNSTKSGAITPRSTKTKTPEPNEIAAKSRATTPQSTKSKTPEPKGETVSNKSGNTTPRPGSKANSIRSEKHNTTEPDETKTSRVNTPTNAAAKNARSGANTPKQDTGEASHSGKASSTSIRDLV